METIKLTTGQAIVEFLDKQYINFDGWDRINRPEQVMSAAINSMRVLTDPAMRGYAGAYK